MILFRRLICVIAWAVFISWSSVVYATDAVALLNSAPLTPVLTPNESCNNLVRNMLREITDERMSTYQKVKACYDWLINNCVYGTRSTYGSNYRSGMTKDDIGVVMAWEMLTGRKGVCEDYSCAFAALMRQIGLNCYTVSGMTAKATSGMTGHTWCIIKINGTEYVFDPQIDDNIAKGGAIGYYRFCKTYAELPGAYSEMKINPYFHPFGYLSPTKSQLVNVPLKILEEIKPMTQIRLYNCLTGIRLSVKKGCFQVDNPDIVKIEPQKNRPDYYSIQFVKAGDVVVTTWDIGSTGDKISTEGHYHITADPADIISTTPERNSCKEVNKLRFENNIPLLNVSSELMQLAHDRMNAFLGGYENSDNSLKRLGTTEFKEFFIKDYRHTNEIKDVIAGDDTNLVLFNPAYKQIAMACYRDRLAKKSYAYVILTE